MMPQSRYMDLGQVTLPPFGGRQLHMHQVDPQAPAMPDGYRDYDEIIRDICQRAGARSREAFVTLDESTVRAGNPQRRPGVHVEGCWLPELQKWGQWRQRDETGLAGRRMSVITAASAAGCVAYEGDFSGTPQDDGDLEEIRAELGDGTLLRPNRAYLLSPDCIHESVTVNQDVERTFLRVVLHLD